MPRTYELVLRVSEDDKLIHHLEYKSEGDTIQSGYGEMPYVIPRVFTRMAHELRALVELNEARRQEHLDKLRQYRVGPGGGLEAKEPSATDAPETEEAPQ